jgi:DNA-binding response OmpR family regulator
LNKVFYPILATLKAFSLDKKEKTVNVAIKRLKAKIDPDGEKDYIRSIRGEGYIFC